jgi:hypothetical protein
MPEQPVADGYPNQAVTAQDQGVLAFDIHLGILRGASVRDEITPHPAEEKRAR